MRVEPPASAYLALVGTTFAFGLSYVATKAALGGFQPLLLAMLRFALAGAILVLVWRLAGGRERATRAELAHVALLGFVSLTVYFTFENLGIALTSASVASVVMGAVPVFILVLNVFTLGEETTIRQWIGVGLSFIGVVALVLFGGGIGSGTLVGVVLLLCACVAAAVYALMARRMLITRSPLFVTAFQNLFGALFMLPLAVVEVLLTGVRRPTWSALGALAYLTVVCSLFAYLLVNYALRHLPVNRAGVFLNLIPVVGVAGAYVILGERFTLPQLAAAGVVVAAVWLTNSGRRAGVVAATPPA